MYMNSITTKLLYVRRMGNSLHVTLPADVVHAYDLETGIAALMTAVPHGIKLKFMTSDELDALSDHRAVEVA
jgi:antitoxin component of MazEF toxin-antitoxin module